MDAPEHDLALLAGNWRIVCASRGALPNTTSTATTGYYLYSPVFLVK